MTTVVDALNRAARQCSITATTSWATATKTELVELRDDFMLETVTDVQDRIDMPAPIGKQATIAGTGAESYSLPTDFHRLARDPMAIYETTTLRRAGTPVGTDGLWTHINQIGGAGAFRYFAVEGYDENWTIKFEDDLVSGDSVTVSYVSKVWLKSAAGVEGDTFALDTDVLLIPRRVIETGIIWRFRQRRGLDFQVPYAQYEAQMARLETDSRNIRTIGFGPQGQDYKVMRVPVPDYIPDT